MSAERLLRWVVVLVALHSVGVGVGLLFLTRWGLALGGWPDVHPLFFARQAGVFHFVVATGYLLEYFAYRGVRLLLATKAIAVVFLTAMFVIDRGPWMVPFSAAGDGLMGLAVWWAYRRAASSSGTSGPSATSGR
jgi:hypothetical protein